jgi:hypothetical protein
MYIRTVRIRSVPSLASNSSPAQLATYTHYHSILALSHIEIASRLSLLPRPSPTVQPSYTHAQEIMDHQYSLAYTASMLGIFFNLNTDIASVQCEMSDSVVNRWHKPRNTMPETQKGSFPLSLSWWFACCFKRCAVHLKTKILGTGQIYKLLWPMNNTM